jgi:regulatory protein
MIDPEDFLRLHPARDFPEEESASSSSENAEDRGALPLSSGDPVVRNMQGATTDEKLTAAREALAHVGNGPSTLFEQSEESGKLYDRCMASALRSLDAAGTSTEGLRKRLLGKDFDADTVDRVIATLVKMKLLDDEAFARSFLNRCLGKMMGPMAVRREMATRGVDSSVVNRLLQEASDTGQFEDSAQQLVESVDRKTRGMDYQKRLRRLAGAAQRKGHSMTDIRRLGRRFFEK